MHVVTLAPGPPRDWRAEAFSGALLMVPQVHELEPFRAYVEQRLVDAFAPAHPLDAQVQLASDDFAARIAPVQQAVRRDERARELLHPVLRRFGLDPSQTFWDRINLRILPSGDLSDEQRDLALGAHRDTWSSNVYAQINWWTPIFPVTADRAVAFYPRHWDTPVPNSSDEWDLDVVRSQRRGGGASTVPLVPAPAAPLDPADALVVVVQPGDVLLFSGAHLHATVPNTSGIPRFSVEVRTVALADVRSGAGAPNVDGAAPRVPWHWFRRVDDATSLADVV